MGAESIIYAALTGDAGVAAIVNNRIYPGLLPKDKPLPAIVQAKPEDAEYIVTIHSSIPCGSRVPLELWCIALTNAEAEALGDAVEFALGTANIVPTGRRADIDPEIEGHAAVITCVVWP